MKEILELLNTLECELDDATNTLPDYNANTDSRGYIDSGKNTLYVIKEKIEEIVEEISLKSYWQDINNIISSTYHMLNVFQNTEELLMAQPKSLNTARIRTVGVVNFDTDKERLFYNLEHPRIKRYYYGINEEFMGSDKDLLHKIRKFTSEQAAEKIKAGFSIYPTNYEHNYVYTVHYASYIQEQKID